MKIIIPDSLASRFVPRIESLRLFEYFLISASATLIGIRVYLDLTGYPQLGGGNLHIAHMLWGGLLMLVAIMLFFSYINSESKAIAAILGGIGFGTFIDELGKFITADNNYFFQPTIALIYLIFVGIYLIARYLASVTNYPSKTYLANAIEGLKELVIHDLDKNGKEKALKYLSLANRNDPMVILLFDLLKKAKPITKKESIYEKYKSKFLKWYSNALHIKWISRLLILYFILAILFNLYWSTQIIITDKEHVILSYGYFFSAVFAGILLIIGIYYYLRRNNLKFYNTLQKAALIGIFLLQFFLFLENQLFGITSFIMFVTVYVVLKYSIDFEIAKKNI